MLLATLVLAALALAGGCGAATGGHSSSTSPRPSPLSSNPDAAVVVAHVNGDVVTKAEVERTLSFSRLSSKPLTYKQALEATVRAHLLSQEAARLGITVTDADVEPRLAQVAASVGGTTALQRQLAAVGLSLGDYRLELRAGLLAERLGARKFPAAVASQRQALSFYRGHRAQLTTPATVRLAEIVVKTKSAGEAVIDRLRLGYSFAEVARVYSMDPESKAAGGVIGWVTTASMPQPLVRALARARAGVVVGPVAAIGGWHVLKVLGRRPAHTQPFAAARAAIVAQVTLERRAALLSAWLAKARAAAHVTIGS